MKFTFSGAVVLGPLEANAPPTNPTSADRSPPPSRPTENASDKVLQQQDVATSNDRNATHDSQATQQRNPTILNDGDDTHRLDDVSRTSVQGSVLKGRLQTGRENVSKQRVVLDKLKKIRGPLEFLRDIGGAAAEVCIG